MGYSSCYQMSLERKQRCTKILSSWVPVDILFIFVDEFNIYEISSEIIFIFKELKSTIENTRNLLKSALFLEINQNLGQYFISQLLLLLFSLISLIFIEKQFQSSLNFASKNIKSQYEKLYSSLIFPCFFLLYMGCLGKWCLTIIIYNIQIQYEL